MREQFGDAYATSVAKDHVLAALGERTVDQALADGVDAKTVWRAVCQEFDVPQRLRCPGPRCPGRPGHRARHAPCHRHQLLVPGSSAGLGQAIFSGDAACWLTVEQLFA